MALDDAKQTLLPELKDHSHVNEKNDLQRRRPWRSSSSPELDTHRPDQNAVQTPSPLVPLAAKSKFSFRQVFMLLAAHLGGGTLCFFLIRNQIKGTKTNGFLDAIYFCVVTMTTVGYGDLVPDSMLAKLLACIDVFTGMALVGLILSKAADYIVEKQEIILARAIHLGEKVGPAELLKEVETHKIKYKFLMTATILMILIFMGILFLYLVENLEFMDAFYCVCSTITTLGYGDQSFSTSVGRTFAVFWILGSTICLAQFFLYLAELSTERRQRSLAKWVLTRRLSPSDLEAADLDHDKVVSAAEFIVYELKEMGKISEHDISVIMERFEKLDYDQSGTLTATDLKILCSGLPAAT
ncbi:Two-pore potassium channel like [Quillaja saponaria]|uniref:Two-pore potassium channel like n=1 Tax=Quillaja saponaria TaxID=32244 RepID=A0AAD7KV47_QUISA|nr:Two-pore potassium channel like [Quillaja saponaria]